MDKTKNNQNKITRGLLVVYLVVLTWIVLFKMQFSFYDLRQFTGFRRINLTPFAGTAIRDGQLDMQEIYYNILGFIPFGIYISMLKPTWPFLKKIAPIAGTSLLFEVLQYILMVGGSDITDLLGNTTGGMIGVMIHLLFLKGFGSKANKILNGIGAIGSIGVFVLTGLWLIGVASFVNFG
ncbi:VanZ family protein [Jeotgalibaca caeni]|uniref:VanZ family protein n=1 Tax=Jeotgalibaca caeni TaxID=3028623 RepID=UPI00237E02C5|nr:VanZ family protein [Jeotgalibaca caeni]MDE1549678.1 VanZ family protein [Jeotgalibaca caeni]